MDGEEEDCLVEEREVEMVAYIGSEEPIKRKACFLKPTSSSTLESLCSPCAPSRYKAISLGAGEAPKVQAHFRWWANPQSQWGEWVEKLKPTYQDLWKEVGIFDAIKASIYNFRRDPSSLWGVVRFWCEETNTFIFPWLEATVTLEDVMVLGGFPVIGEPVRVSGPLEGELREIESEMIRELRKIKRSNCRKVEHSVWIRHYMKEGEADESEHIAFLSLWLSRFVFPASNGKTIGEYLIQIAVRLARGVRIALAPAVLASLYQGLRAMKDYLTTHGAAPLSVWAPFNILQLWVWERFLALRPDSKTVINSDEPRAARWHDVGKVLDFSYVMSVLESPYEFQWRPYVIGFDHWCKPSFYKDEGEWVCSNVAEDEELGSFAQCLRACELVGLDCLEQYLPHRVAMQFGLDQEIPNCVPRANSTWKVAWETYDISAKNVKFYVPPRVFESAVTLQYSTWWKNVERKEMVAGKKRKEAHPLPNSKKKKVQDFYEISPSDCLALSHHGISRKSTCLKSQEQQACATKPQRIKLKQSLKCLETMNQNLDVSREIQVENGKQLDEEFASDPLDVEDEGIMKGVKKTNVGEFAYDPIVIEEPKVKCKMEERDESTAVMDKESKRELEIKKLKEEIASIQARVMYLESLAEVPSKSELVSSVS